MVESQGTVHDERMPYEAVIEQGETPRMRPRGWAKRVLVRDRRTLREEPLLARREKRFGSERWLQTIPDFGFQNEVAPLPVH